VQSPKDISIQDYDYELPEERIARFPLEVRDASKLLVCKNGVITHTPFRQITEVLPPRALLLFNDTKVIHARLYFTLPNGSRLEILCLEPLSPVEYQLNFSSMQTVRWKCLVGGNRKWKSGEIIQEVKTEGGKVQLKATRLTRLEDAFDIQFEWDNSSLAFGELLAMAGIIPLPPYLNREAEASDKDRYQTVYAQEQGSVAAPTAGLHFTETVFSSLKENGFDRLFLTLHVGAGTFKPVKAERLEGHHMHQESIYISKEKIEQLLEAISTNRPIIPVGTTSMRLLESLYWHGVQLLSGEDLSYVSVRQWIPYESDLDATAVQSLQAILSRMDRDGQHTLQGHTELIIAPSYEFRIANGIITNFHQPRSTLLLLIAALIGDHWKNVYDYALENDFRFLSYGDSSLLLP
jgi:S-adenosylmethionine:tRNA ribosyltransferase-isomerase